MVQSAPAKRNALHELGYKIFLDRYAQKDMKRSTLQVGDTVIVVVDSATGQREIGKITALNLPQVTIELLDGDVVTRDLEHVDKPLETEPEQMMARVAQGIASVEATPELQAQWTERFKWLLDDWKFVPAGRILTAAGTNQELTFYNCYVVSSPRDSRHGIIETLRQMTEIMSRGGGVGINISTLRPRHAYVKGVNGRSSGSVSWGALYSFVTGLIEQGGCILSDSILSTNLGDMPILDVIQRFEHGLETRVWTHKGWKKVTDRFHNGIKAVYRLKTKAGYQLEATDNHPIMTLNQATGQLELKYLRDVKIGDTIGVLIGNRPELETVQLNSNVPLRSKHESRTREYGLPERLDVNLAYLIGYFVANGSILSTKTCQAGGGIRFVVSERLERDADLLVNKLKSAFTGLAVKATKSNQGGWFDVDVRSTYIQDFLKLNGLLKPNSKQARVPELIKRSGKSVVEAFLAGYFAGDGSFLGQPYCSSASPAFITDLQQLLLSVGIPSKQHANLKVVQESDDSEAREFLTYILTFPGAKAQERLAEIMQGQTQRVDDFVPTSEERSWVWPVNLTENYERKVFRDIHNYTALNTSVAAVQKALTRKPNDAMLTLLASCVPTEVEQIEYIGEHETFDITVEDVHLFSANGIYTGNSRRGALMLILNDWHPDVFDFINSKRAMGQITNANISVGVSDKLMEAVEADGDWDLMFPDTSYSDYTLAWDGDIEKWIADGRRVVKHRTVKAREVWNAIIESAWASAEPGVWFNERSNKMSNSWYYDEGKLIATNPCGEQPLAGWSVCNLGAINFSRFYDEAKHDVNWEMLGTVARYATRFLDNVIDATPYFFDENYEQQKKERRVGLNTMGLAELMIKMGIRYGSDESVEFINKVYAFFATTVYETSIEIAREKGAFPMFDAEKFVLSGFMQSMPAHIREKVKQHGIRNVTLLTQAPNGTIGTMVNTSTGIEPFFSWVYYRKSRLGLHEEQVPLVKEWYAKNPDARDLPDYFVTAMNLAPEEHVKVQAAIQRWVDSAISKTSNLPNNYTVEQVSDLYKYMYELGCKGGTIYRDGSRSEQVLMLKGDERAEKEMEGKAKARESEKIEQTATPHRVYPRPEMLSGVTVKCTTPFGTAYVTMNSDENGYPFEVFITAPGKAGSDLQADAEGLGRMVSLALRTTAPQNRLDMLRLVIEQLKDIGGTSRVGFGPARVNSLPDALANVLQNHYFSENAPQQMALPINGTPAPINKAAPTSEKKTNGNGKKQSFDICPSCGNASLVHAEGCSTCQSCGYSKC